ncbi:hypothetical protein Tco_0110665 [Tanacetum coccineum]
MPLPLLSSLGGVGEYSDEVIMNRLSVNCSMVRFYGKIEHRGVGDLMIGLGIKNFSHLERGSSSETFSSEAFTFEAWKQDVAQVELNVQWIAALFFELGSKVEQFSFHPPSFAAPPDLDQRYLDLVLPFPTSPLSISFMNKCCRIKKVN